MITPIVLIKNTVDRIPEIAEALGVTDRTVRRDWEKARLLLREEQHYRQTAVGSQARGTSAAPRGDRERIAAARASTGAASPRRPI